MWKFRDFFMNLDPKSFLEKFSGSKFMKKSQKFHFLGHTVFIYVIRLFTLDFLFFLFLIFFNRPCDFLNFFSDASPESMFLFIETNLWIFLSWFEFWLVWLTAFSTLECLVPLETGWRFRLKSVVRMAVKSEFMQISIFPKFA